MVLRYAKMINGIDSLVVTKLDVFDTQREIQVCVGYKYKGKALKEMPALAEEYEHVMPEYKTLPGWCEIDLRREGCRRNCRRRRWTICGLLGISCRWRSE